MGISSEWTRVIVRWRGWKLGDRCVANPVHAPLKRHLLFTMGRAVLRQSSVRCRALRGTGMTARTLESKIALVTGGGTGIGRAVALELSQAGAHVVVTGRHEQPLRETAAQGAGISWVVADVSRLTDAAATLEEVRCRHQRLDILVNNAGVAAMAPLSDATPEHVRQVFDVNVSGLIEVTRHALPLLRETHGTIVNVASVAADQPFANLSVYSASKAAVLALTRAWAQELASAGIRVNVVSPGPIETPILERAGLAREQLDEIGSDMMSQVPLRRFGKPEEVAAVVGFLASPQSSFVTGAQYAVGGGIEA
jgi:NAD(P)-dependent dehydrogenase (short-subunit alcohol dehydrogenase family)